jgi:hypothetical protein
MHPTGTALAKQASVRRFTTEPLTGSNDMTKSRFNLLTVGVVLCGITASSAQTASAPASAEEAPAYQPFSVGAEVATPGFGGSASWRFVDNFGVRAGFNYFSYSKTGNEIDGINYNTDLRLMSEPIAVDYYPWAKSSFRVTVGIMLNQNELTGVSPADPVANRTFVEIGSSGHSYDSAAIGDLNLKVEQQPISPYISIGYSYYFDKAKHWSLSGELGVAYTGNPDVTLTTGTPNSVPQQDLNAEAAQIEDTASKYKFFPILRLGVNYSF